MEHIRELTLEDTSFGIDPAEFMQSATAMIQKTHRLVHLSLLPNGKRIEWIKVLADNAPKLHHLNSLTIATEFPLESRVDQEFQ